MGRSLVLFLCLVAVLVGQSAAHFLLNYPPTVGFDDDLETTAPCGSFTVDFTKDNVTDFHVGGDAIALTSIHPQATWLFRATLDITAASNWTSLLPTILQGGLGDFCEPSVAVPASWAGSKGVIGVVQDAPDGILYQCAAVNFVAGTLATLPSQCTNVTGLSASVAADAALTSVAGAPAVTGSQTAGGSAVSPPAATPTGSASTTSSTSKPSAGNTIHSHEGLSSLVWVFAFGSATLLACLL